MSQALNLKHVLTLMHKAAQTDRLTDALRQYREIVPELPDHSGGVAEAIPIDADTIEQLLTSCIWSWLDDAVRSDTVVGWHLFAIRIGVAESIIARSTQPLADLSIFTAVCLAPIIAQYRVEELESRTAPLRPVLYSKLEPAVPIPKPSKP